MSMSQWQGSMAQSEKDAKNLGLTVWQEVVAEQKVQKH